MSLLPNPKKRVYSVVFLGSGGVGKTSIITRMMGQQFNQAQVTTVGVVNNQHVVDYKGRKVILKLQDTAGQEKYKSLTKQFYKDCYAVVVVFANDDPISLQQAPEFMRQFQLHYQNSLADQDYVPITIVAKNKTDLESQVNPAAIQNTLKSLPENFPQFKSFQNIKLFETSAFNGQNMQELLNYVVEQLDERGAFLNESNQVQSIHLGQAQQGKGQQDQEQKKKKDCEC